QIEIIGTLAPKGQSRDGANEDDLLVIPLRTALRRILNIRHLDVIYVQTRDRASLNTAETSIRETLRRQHRLDRRRLIDDFSISNQAALITTVEETRRSFQMLILWTSGIALLLGGFGILAIMLLSVRERTSEIGLRLAVGARRRDILLQFLIEAFGFAIGGGLIGVVLGAISCHFAQSHLGLATLFSLQTVSFAVLFSVTTGLVFGVLPARRASRLSPVDALDVA
ncbi:MAG: FtsX-like permease family protein, partial [bacterium]|nr:FtsX-like permease family protein [bacterium]